MKAQKTQILVEVPEPWRQHNGLDPGLLRPVDQSGHRRVAGRIVVPGNVEPAQRVGEQDSAEVCRRELRLSVVMSAITNAESSIRSRTGEMSGFPGTSLLTQVSYRSLSLLPLATYTASAISCASTMSRDEYATKTIGAPAIKRIIPRGRAMYRRAKYAMISRATSLERAPADRR
jgi:hypothetical protein